MDLSGSETKCESTDDGIGEDDGVTLLGVGSDRARYLQDVVWDPRVESKELAERQGRRRQRDRNQQRGSGRAGPFSEPNSMRDVARAIAVRVASGMVPPSASFRGAETDRAC